MNTFKISSFRFLLNFFFSSCLLLFISCDTRFNLPEFPAPIPETAPPECVRLALVLGGGGTKGMAHVGVLEEFEKAGIQIDLLVGCSAGSIVSVLYADCPRACRIKKLLRPLKKWDVLDISIWQGRYGLVQGGSLRSFLKRHLSCRFFEELQIPVCIAATDLIRGELVCINSGPIISAVHASSAVPLVFTPVLLYDRLLVDGGVADPVPVKLAKKMGARVIVAVDLSAMLEKTCPRNLFGVASRSAEIKFLLQSESCVAGADVVIRPDLGCMGMFDDTNLEKTYEAGRKAAEEAIPKILEKLAQNA